jgi:hypothetical protein
MTTSVAAGFSLRFKPAIAKGYPHPFINLFEIPGERIFSLILVPIFIGTPR